MSKYKWETTKRYAITSPSKKFDLVITRINDNITYGFIFYHEVLDDCNVRFISKRSLEYEIFTDINEHEVIKNAASWLLTCHTDDYKWEVTETTKTEIPI